MMGPALAAGPLDNLPPSRWQVFANSHLDEVRPSGVTATGVRAVMYAWNSGVLDTDRDQLVVWGGGHNDYSGNEVYAFGPINGANPHWTRLTDPSSPPAVNTPHAADGRPVSRHTYNLLTYLPAPANKMMSCAIGSQHSNGFANAALDFYNLAVDGFTGEPWSVGATPPSNTYAIGGICIHDPVTGRVWYHDNGSNSARLQQYNPATNTWTAHAQFEFGGYAAPAIDPARHLLVMTGLNVNSQPGQTYVWDLEHPNDQPFKPTLSGPGNVAQGQGPGFVYDPVGQRFLAWNGGTAIFALTVPANPRTGTWVWSEIALDPGNTVVPTRVAHADANAGDYDTGTYGRFRYVPSAHGLIAVNATNENVYFFKLPGTPVSERWFADGFE